MPEFGRDVVCFHCNGDRQNQANDIVGNKSKGSREHGPGNVCDLGVALGPSDWQITHHDTQTREHQKAHNAILITG